MRATRVVTDDAREERYMRATTVEFDGGRAEALVPIDGREPSEAQVRLIALIEAAPEMADLVDSLFLAIAEADRLGLDGLTIHFGSPNHERIMALLMRLRGIASPAPDAP